MARAANRRGAREHLSVFVAMLVKNLKVSASYPVNMVSNMLLGLVMFPLFLFLVASFWRGGVAGVLHTAEGRRAGASFIWGYALYQFASDALWTVGHFVRQEQIEGTLESLFLSPASRLIYLLARVCQGFLFSAAALLLAVILGVALFGTPQGADPLLALYAFACGLLGMVGLSLALAGLALLFQEAAQPIVQCLQILMLTACAMLMPFSVLPAPLRRLSELIPLSYCVDLFRFAIIGRSGGYPELAPAWHEVRIAAAWVALSVPIGFMIFAWADRRCRTSGVLAHH